MQDPSEHPEAHPTAEIDDLHPGDHVIVCDPMTSRRALFLGVGPFRHPRDEDRKCDEEQVLLQEIGGDKTVYHRSRVTPAISPRELDLDDVEPTA